MKENKKADIIWHHFLRTVNEGRLEEMRANLGIPIKGFKSKAEKEGWFKKYQIKRKNDATPEKILRNTVDKLHSYVNEIRRSDKSIHSGFMLPIYELIFFGRANKESVIKSNATGCTFLPVTPAQATAHIPAGLYIRVGENTNILDVKRFLNKNGKTIFDHFHKSVYPKRNTRLKMVDFKKQDLLYYLGSFSTRELREMAEKYLDDDVDFKSFTQDILIARLMTHWGYTMAPNNVRTTLARERKKHKK